MTSEQTRDIIPQPRDTCPMIDSVINVYKMMARDIEGYKYADEDELKTMLCNVKWDLDQSDKLEEIRTNVSLIRQWGEEWKQYALHLEKEYNVKLEEETS